MRKEKEISRYWAAIGQSIEVSTDKTKKINTDPWKNRNNRCKSNY